MSSTENPGSIQPENADPKKDVKEKGDYRLHFSIAAVFVALVPSVFPLALIIAGMYGQKAESGKFKRHVPAGIMILVATIATYNGSSMAMLVAGFFVGGVFAHSAWHNRNNDKVVSIVSVIGALVALSAVFEGHHTQMAVFAVVFVGFALRMQEFLLRKATQKQAEGDNSPSDQQVDAGQGFLGYVGQQALTAQSFLTTLGQQVKEKEGVLGYIASQVKDKEGLLGYLAQQVDAKRAELAELNRELAEKRAAVQQQRGQHSTMELRLPADGTQQQSAPPMPQTPPPGTHEG